MDDVTCFSDKLSALESRLCSSSLPQDPQQARAAIRCILEELQATCEKPDTIQAIKGDIDAIERVDGRSEVIVDEGISQAVYPLDESLIDFGTVLLSITIFTNV